MHTHTDRLVFVYVSLVRLWIPNLCIYTSDVRSCGFGPSISITLALAKDNAALTKIRGAWDCSEYGGNGVNKKHGAWQALFVCTCLGTSRCSRFENVNFNLFEQISLRFSFWDSHEDLVFFGSQLGRCFSQCSFDGLGGLECEGPKD